MFLCFPECIALFLIPHRSLPPLQTCLVCFCEADCKTISNSSPLPVPRDFAMQFCPALSPTPYPLFGPMDVIFSQGKVTRCDTSRVCLALTWLSLVFPLVCLHHCLKTQPWGKEQKIPANKMSNFQHGSKGRERQKTSQRPPERSSHSGSLVR